MNKFNKESNETHYAKTDSCGNGDFLELCKQNKIKETVIDKQDKMSSLPFLSGFVHLFTSLTESLENWRPGSNTLVT